MNIDFNLLKESLTPNNIIDIVLNLGADRYDEKDNYIIFPTICHNYEASSASMKLYYYKNNYSFHCYTECGESFNIYSLILKRWELININREEIQFFQVVNFILSIINKDEGSFELNGRRYQSILDKYKTRDILTLPEINSNLLSIFNKYYTDEWLSENIDIEVMKKFNILYSISQNKIIIPHYDINNRLIGIRGRALSQEEIDAGCKYMPVKIEGKYYAHPLSLNLYGLNHNKGNLLNSDKIFLFEGEKSVLLYETYFKNNISAAVCGSNLNKNQINILLNNFQLREVIICFDKEYNLSNSIEGEEYFNKLYTIGKKYSHYFNFSFIYDTKNLLDKKDSPIDKGKKIFLQLYQGRVKIQ